MPVSYIKELKIGADVSPAVENGIRQAFQLMHRYALSLGLSESEITRDLSIYVWNLDVDDFIAPYQQISGGSAAEARRELEGRRNGASFGGRYILIPTHHRGEYTTARLMKTPAHELVHAFSSNLASLSKGGLDHLVPPAGPEWINEGGADYLANRAISWGGVFPYAIIREQTRQRALEVNPQGGLAELGSEDGLDKYSGSYLYSMMAVELLVSERGDASYLEFYRSLQQGTTWQAEFEKAFGISVEDFYVKFAEHEATGFPPLGDAANFCPANSPDKAALVALYDATGGAGWADNTNWMSDAPICEWHGVLADADGRVIILNLQRNQLSGELPPELGNLSHLQELYLRENHLTGPIPAGLGSLSNLTHLDLNLNSISGPLPAELGNLSNLRSLKARGNQLTGEIPVELGKLSNLARVCLRDTQLSGTIPAEMGNLSSLAHLDLRRNKLSGVFPAELASLSNVSSLRLAGNQLTGCVPAGLKGVRQHDLDDLSLPDCN